MKIQSLFAILISALTSQLASADESNFYFGGAIGTSAIDFNNGDFDTQFPNSKETLIYSVLSFPRRREPS